MRRKITKFLEEWKVDEYRKPLVLQGARQVGKTYAVLEFAKHNYDNFIYLNFESNPNLIQLFDSDIMPEKLVPLLSSALSDVIIKKNTLIVFDEVQLCERALTSLKYFCEFDNDYHVIALGSLLGVAVNRGQFSFPVGKVDIKTMYPMDLEEFLMAMNEDSLVKMITECFHNNTPMPLIFHEKALKLYKEYLVVGGLPECVLKYVMSDNLAIVRNSQNTILQSYLNDMSKYNKVNEIKKVRLTYDSLTVQLSRKNTKFSYKLIKSGARASEFENAIEWLTLSGIISKVFMVKNVSKPLENFKVIAAFKIYVSDTGLLCAKKNIFVNDVFYNDSSLYDFKGGMTENYVNSSLIASGYKTYFWESSGEAEIDFLIQKDGDIIPVEVKSSENTRSKSLVTYTKTYKPVYSIKVSTKNFAFEDNKKYIPLYAVFCI